MADSSAFNAAMSDAAATLVSDSGAMSGVVDLLLRTGLKVSLGRARCRQWQPVRQRGCAQQEGRPKRAAVLFSWLVVRGAAVYRTPPLRTRKSTLSEIHFQSSAWVSGLEPV